MSEIIHTRPVALPAPKTPMRVRVATMEDLAFIDALQKKHSKALGFFPRAQMEGYVDAGHVLVAEGWEGEAPAEPETSSDPRGSAGASPSQAGASPSQAGASPSRRLGYVVSKDRYLKRDELGVIFQLCVEPGYERQFIAANLLRDVFERSSYGCRLYCCWCAQDLPANRFWEAMGFTPLAFRAGSEKKSRVHIFWQKRIRANDTTTPFWFPAKTEGGAIREDRIILPIPPGMKWSDDLPRLLPTPVRMEAASTDRQPKLPGERAKSTGARAKPTALPIGRRSLMSLSRLRTIAPAVPQAPAKTTVKPAREKRKCDPALIAKARELRDRWMEHVGAGNLVLPAGKYDLARLHAA